MKKLISILDGLSPQKHVYVDSNYLQGKEAVYRQLERRAYTNEKINVESFINISKQTINGLEQKIQPYPLPDDYLFFLEYCGGLSIDIEDYHFSILGIGPMVEEDYYSIDSDFSYPDILEKFEYLAIGDLSFRKSNLKFQRVTSFLDYAGKIQQNCVFTVGPWIPGLVDPIEFFENLAENKESWRIVSNSFTGWLEIVAETIGSFNYLQ